ncbi:hypothetical protein BB560_007331, partial [Smittium megazygosporum]
MASTGFEPVASAPAIRGKGSNAAPPVAVSGIEPKTSRSSGGCGKSGYLSVNYYALKNKPKRSNPPESNRPRQAQPKAFIYHNITNKTKVKKVTASTLLGWSLDGK